MGGNRKAKRFFDSHGEIQRGMSLSDKYNTRTAALYRDKVTGEFCLEEECKINVTLFFKYFAFLAIAFFTISCTCTSCRSCAYPRVENGVKRSQPQDIIKSHQGNKRKPSQTQFLAVALNQCELFLIPP